MITGEISMSLTNKNYEDARNQYADLAKQYTSGSMYNKAKQMAGESAQEQSQVAGSKAQAQARNAGMTKQQSALMGANQSANTYNDVLATQQDLANQSLGQGANIQGQVMGTESGQQSTGQKLLNVGTGILGKAF